MKIETRGVVIDRAKNIQSSMLGDEYVCMFDENGVPIHIKKDIIDSLYSVSHVKKAIVPPTDYFSSR